MYRLFVRSEGKGMTKEIRPDHVAIYIRWSTEDQASGTTLEVQREACEHYVKSQGWHVRDEYIFIDDGFSGGTLDRPAMRRLRELVRKGEIDCVVVFKLDRLSRSVIDTVNLVLGEWDDLAYVKSAREPLDTTTPLGRQILYILAGFAEWERSVIRDRMFSGRVKQAEKGRTPGMPRPYGYGHGDDPSGFTIVPDEARVVSMVFDLAEKGVSVRGITRILNAQHIPTRKGGLWNTSMVSKMLHNPIYCGRLVWGRRRINPRWKKTPGETRVIAAEPYVSIDNAVPAIVTVEQFERVQSIMAGNRKFAAAATGSEHLLTGLLVCGKCGAPMQCNVFQEKDTSRRYAYYRCARKLNQKSCDALAIPAHVLESTVIDEVRQRFEPAATAEAISFRQRLLENLINRLHDSIKILDAEVEKLSQQETRIDSDYLEGRLTAEDRSRLISKVRKDRREVEAKKSTLLSELDRANATVQFISEQGVIIQDINVFRSLEPARQKALLRMFLKRIHAVRDPDSKLIRVQIEWIEMPEHAESLFESFGSYSDTSFDSSPNG